MRAHIFGNVHGIGFRAETKFFADKLQLKGHVRNCSDGSVEIVAQGSKKDLELLLKHLQDRFQHYLKHIDKEFHESAKHYSSFTINNLSE